MEWSVIGSYFQNVSHFVRSYPDSGMSPVSQSPVPLASPSLQTPPELWLGMSCTNILQTSGFCHPGPGHTDDWSRANTQISSPIGQNAAKLGV